MIKNGQVQEACTQVGHILADLINPVENPADKLGASVAISMAALSFAASMVMKDFNPSEGILPTSDHLLFAALLVWGSCHLESSGRLAVESSPEMLLNTMDQFEKFTGQSSRPLLNKNLVEFLDHIAKIDRSKFGNNSKFLPN